MNTKVRAKRLALVRAKRLALLRASKTGQFNNGVAIKRAGKIIGSKVQVLNLNKMMVVTTITDEEKKHAFKTGHFAEMSLKLAGIQN